MSNTAAVPLPIEPEPAATDQPEVPAEPKPKAETAPEAVDEPPAPSKTDTSYVILSALAGANEWDVVSTQTARDADAAKLAYCETLEDFTSATLVAVAAKFWKPSTVKAQTVTTTTLVLGDPS